MRLLQMKYLPQLWTCIKTRSKHPYPFTCRICIAKSSKRVIAGTDYQQLQGLSRFSRLHFSSVSKDNENAIYEKTVQDVSFEEVQKSLSSGKILLVDVREPSELIEFGQYDGAINIPLGQLQNALRLDDVNFRSKFAIEKPREQDSIVFCCQAGVRSYKAIEVATRLGYSNAQHYKGGWEDYHKRMNLPYRRQL